jgi:cytochrome P450
MAPMIDYDPYAEAVMADPHPFYRQLRDEAPAYYVEKYDAWALTRFEDVWMAAGEPTLFSSTAGTLPAQVLTKEQPVIPILNYVDPPEHSELRGLFNSRFTPRAVNAMESAVRAAAVELLERGAAAETFDFVEDFAMPFSTRVAADVIGVPAGDMPAMVDWMQRFFRHDPDGGSMTPDGIAALDEVNRFGADLTRERRKRPNEAKDAINAMLAHEKVTGKAFSDEEAGMHLGMLVIAGAETSAKALALTISLLARYPDQKRCLQDDPGLIVDGFHEALRFDNPTQFLCRTVAQPTKLHGQSMSPGQGVMLLYASGNRDEREFDRPEVFDVTRRPARILSFSVGRHLCLGIHVARLEARVALEEILKRYPNFEVDFDHAETIRTEFIRGYTHLPIRLGSRSASREKDS